MVIFTFKRGIIFSIISLISLQLQAQLKSSNFSPEIISLIQGIEQGKILAGEKAVRNSKNKQYERFKSLSATASKKELLNLLENTKGVTKCYTFWALAKTNPKKIEQILENHMTDNTIVSTLFDYKIGKMKVNEFMLKVVSSPTFEPECAKISSKEVDRLKAMMK